MADEAPDVQSTNLPKDFGMLVHTLVDEEAELRRDTTDQRSDTVRVTRPPLPSPSALLPVRQITMAICLTTRYKTTRPLGDAGVCGQEERDTSISCSVPCPPKGPCLEFLLGEDVLNLIADIGLENVSGAAPRPLPTALLTHTHHHRHHYAP